MTGFGVHFDLVLRARAVEEEREQDAVRRATTNHQDETVELLVSVLTSYTWEAWHVDEPTRQERDTVEHIVDAISRLRRHVLLAIHDEMPTSLEAVVRRRLNILEASRAWSRFDAAEDTATTNEALLSIVFGALEPPEERTHLGEVGNGKPGAA